MISVEQALARVTAAFEPLETELVSLSEGLGRILAENLHARVTQPPCPVSSMDGYAVRSRDLAKPPVTLTQVGEVAAGGRHDQPLAPGQCVRIFTGAPLPPGANSVVIQEDVTVEANGVTFPETVPEGRFVRPAGLDFKAGDLGLPAGRRLSPRDIGLAAAMNVPWLTVHRQPRIAVLSTGDELVLPGTTPGPSEIVASNGFSLSAFVRLCGAQPLHLGIAEDLPGSLEDRLAAARGADLLVTSGGASVGKHDIVGSVLESLGMELDFWRIAMRPGRPLMFGRMGALPVLGLPGNPVSSLVCAELFLKPAIDIMRGCRNQPHRTRRARLASDLAANDLRQDYLRARLREEGGQLLVEPFPRQDSSMLAVLAEADCLIVRPPHAPAIEAGEAVNILPLSGCYSAV